MPRNKRVVITGIGPITSIGTGKDELWSKLVSKKTNIKAEKTYLEKELWEEFKYHKVENFNLSKFGIKKDSLEWIKDWKQGEENLDLSFMIASIKLALDDSNLSFEDTENNGLGLVVTHENMSLMPLFDKLLDKSFSILTDKTKEVKKKEYYKQIYEQCLKVAYDVQPFMTLFHVAKVFNIHKHSLFICNACASGLYAIETAYQMINSDQNSKVIVSASDHSDIYKFVWFRDLGIYSQDALIKPFSKGSNGFIIGDAGISLVLEDYDSAKKRNAHIYGEYLGGRF
ncbi:beta-ketoacyl synthase N-terminal-like domain-containing protein [Elusimicrobiota bacterium]